MKEIFNTQDAAIYVGTYKKYNEGSLFGKWMQLSDYNDKDEFLQACHELHKDEDDAEFMFQDWEYIPEGLIGESWVSEKVWDLMSLDEGDAEIVTHYCAACSIKMDEYEIDDLVSEAKERFVGKFEDAEDLGYYEAECWDIPEHLERYFDYKKLGEECAMDYYEEDGYYFDTNR